MWKMLMLEDILQSEDHFTTNNREFGRFLPSFSIHYNFFSWRNFCCNQSLFVVIPTGFDIYYIYIIFRFESGNFLLQRKMQFIIIYTIPTSNCFIFWSLKTMKQNEEMKQNPVGWHDRKKSGINGINWVENGRFWSELSQFNGMTLVYIQVLQKSLGRLSDKE